MRMLIIIGLLAPLLFAHPDHSSDPFRQLDEVLPTPNAQRAGNGSPGPAYWQQQADYEIEVSLDDENQTLSGTARITYFNNSPQSLPYLWLQLDQNRHRADAPGHQSQIAPSANNFSYGSLSNYLNIQDFPGGHIIQSLRDAEGRELPYTINQTMLRIDLPEALPPQTSFSFQVDWNYQILDVHSIWARSGYEHFPEEDNYLYTIAQWHPRLCVFDDHNGWQNKQFLGRGEFALTFGNFEVSITVPADHIVAATGMLQNPEEVLSPTQNERLEQAKESDKPLFIVTPEEALAAESSRASETKTWRFQAENVRDFAFASSRKFIWDAASTTIEDKPILAMSYYPKEGNPLWEKYSTHSVLHTLDVYSRHTIPYPYPVCISVNGPVFGMEYPMISFNGPRPEEDGTYSRNTKYGLISVIIHEVGHNWFPMIINSDERQWSWMDEGLNTFLQFLAEQEWEENYPSRGGHPDSLVNYLQQPDRVPIMTNSESITHFGSNAYQKPSVALNILRESVLGRENFDFAFKHYCQQWAFKHPTPADFFRSMEDASGTDLDWFWRGWFYTTNHVELSIPQVILYNIDSKNPEIEKPLQREREKNKKARFLTNQNNTKLNRYVERFPELLDFYNENDAFTVTPADTKSYEKFLEDLKPYYRDIINSEELLYRVSLKNKGALPTPVTLQITYEDDSTRLHTLPAEIWRFNSTETHTLLVETQAIKSINLDPHFETPDINRHNNTWAGSPVPMPLTPTPRDKTPNLMKTLQEEEEETKAEEETEEENAPGQ